MGFIDEVQAWLRRQPEPPQVLPEVPAELNLAGRREVMFKATESISPPRWQRAAHARWTTPGFLERFIAELVTEIRSGVGATWKGSRLLRAVDQSLRASVRNESLVGGEVGGPVVALELDRVRRLAEQRAGTLLESPASSIQDLGAWCRATGLLDDDGQPSSVGRVFIRLVGREAVVFILEIEVSLSLGASDDLRVSRSTLAALARDNLVYDDDIDPAHWAPYNYQCLKRLSALGVAVHVQVAADEIDRFYLSDDARDIIETVLDPSPNPYRALVQALQDAERGRLATTATGQAPTAGTDLAYVRMVVHELRNATLPLSNALNRLWTELERSGGPDPVRVDELRQRVERAMDRIDDFTRQSAHLAAAVTSESFSLRDVVEEAVRATEPDRNGRIRVDLDGIDDATIEGGRVRWVLLFVNLLRNAAQVRSGPGTVWISTEWSLGGPLHVFVDDDGPGVPEELRERVFELGVSTRGGSGTGLHEARMTTLLSNGSLRCETAPKGGARFHIQVPARRRT